MDDRLSSHLYQLLGGILSIMGTIGLVLYSYAWLGILLIPMFALYYLFGVVYARSARQVRRINSTMRSYVYSAFGEQLSGVVSIRAYRQQQVFSKRFSSALDNEGRFYYIIIFSNIWLSLRLDLLGSILILGIGIFGVLFRNDVSPAKLSAVLTYSLQTTQMFSQIIVTYTRLEREMNTCERVLFYGQLPAEAPPKKDNDPDKTWPSKGEVTFQGVHLKYRPELPPVLKGLSFHISPGEKIGIVGRTGAGKSSCLQALFRLVELSEGKITIDGVDLAEIGLDTVRQRLSAIPQEPLLFSGSVRENLDPEGTKSDVELNDALRRCGLIHSQGQFQGRFNKFKLDAQIADEGGNFSGGERQLIALCRALVKNSKVLMLDEATSSVDPETDATIQKTIRGEFGHVTLLCIAHRLATIAFYDRVLVLDQGTIAEFDTPLNLYDREDSTFRSMCEAAHLDRETILKIRNQGPAPLKDN
ncbi:hypothetical protein NCC49_000792 [Naganishia albida]|nr:hypothetical protein NCC49_000792 [Naganishia albida]